MGIHFSGFRFCEEENKYLEFERDPEEYSAMHKKDFIEMNKTKQNIKMKYSEWFPEKTEKTIG